MQRSQKTKLVLIIVILALLIGSLVAIQIASVDTRSGGVFEDFVSACSAKNPTEAFSQTTFSLLNTTDSDRSEALNLLTNNTNYLQVKSATVTLTSYILQIRGHMTLDEVIWGVKNYTALEVKMRGSHVIDLNYMRIEAKLHMQGTGINKDYNLSCYSYDIDGSWYIHLASIVESTAPVTTITGASPSGWYTTNVTASLMATDTVNGTAGVGVDSTYYRLNSGAWQNYTGNIVISSEGSTKIEYYSVDLIGNTEKTNSVTVKIDKTGPNSTIGLSGIKVLANYTTNVTIWINSTDALSGLNQIYYKLNSATTWEAYSDEFVLTANGTYVIHYRSLDLAGNFETEKTLTITIAKP